MDVAQGSSRIDLSSFGARKIPRESEPPSALFWLPRVRKGTWFGKIQPALASALAWVFAVFLETLFLVLAPRAPDPYLWTVAILAGMVILLGAGFQLIGARLHQTKLAMRESFLCMEYRLAELAEALAKKQQQ